MNFTRIALAATAAIAIALAATGCAGGQVANTAKVAPEVTASAAPSETPIAAPVTIEPTAEAAATDSYNGFASQREWFLRSLAGALSGTPSDDALIGAGALACEQLKAGTPRADVRVIDGGTDQDNQNIVGAAIEVYCPEFT